jgi:phosphatidylserine decarboxylase
MVRVVVFLNVFNVHVNRTPMGGTVKKVVTSCGGFAHAGSDADKNERCSVWLGAWGRRPVVVTQLTGFIAPDHQPRGREGSSSGTARRYGLIRFGSRTDV